MRWLQVLAGMTFGSELVAHCAMPFFYNMRRQFLSFFRCFQAGDSQASVRQLRRSPCTAFDPLSETELVLLLLKSNEPDQLPVRGDQ